MVCHLGNVAYDLERHAAPSWPGAEKRRPPSCSEFLDRAAG